MPKVVTLPHGEWGKDAADWPGTSEQWRERLRQAEREAETQTAGRFHLLTPEEMAAYPALADTVISLQTEETLPGLLDPSALEPESLLISEEDEATRTEEKDLTREERR